MEKLQSPLGFRRVFPDVLTARLVALYLVGIAGLSTLVRIGLVRRVQAPTVFSDELGYERLAQSLGQTGHFALFNHAGLSYSPLYSALLAPIYALGASAPTAYEWTKITNAVLMSLSIFPTYKIARFVLARRPALLVASLGAVAPLMFYTSFTMSENLAYPLCLVAIWAMLEAMRTPRVRNDGLLLASIAVVCAARVQLIVLVPAALTAALLASAFERESEESVLRTVASAVKRHGLLFGSAAAGLVIAGLSAIGGAAVYSIFGRYANVGRAGLPDAGHFFDLLLRHLAGLVFGVGIIPFAAALVAAFAFGRLRRRREHIVFASVAVSVTVWLLLEVAWVAALFDSPSGDVPRIHERFLIYVLPLFLTTLIATVGFWSFIPGRVYVAAALITAVLPAAIPFGTVINDTVSVDSFGLELFGRIEHGELTAIPHATVYAIAFAATVSLLYAHVRSRMRTVVMVLLVPFFFAGGLARNRIEGASVNGRSRLPAHVDWVDRAMPAGGVTLVTWRRPGPELLTAFSNLSVKRLYYLCAPAFGPDFGEQAARISRSGRLVGTSAPIRALYIVAPAKLHISGRVVARNPKGHEVLVAPDNSRASVAPAWRGKVGCKR
jgi:Dolichyl-phosphate-mannose-protein mannosyltransferase